MRKTHRINGRSSAVPDKERERAAQVKDVDGKGEWEEGERERLQKGIHETGINYGALNGIPRKEGRKEGRESRDLFSRPFLSADRIAATTTTIPRHAGANGKSRRTERERERKRGKGEEKGWKKKVFL